jgi:hypothetical protein
VLDDWRVLASATEKSPDLPAIKHFLPDSTDD